MTIIKKEWYDGIFKMKDAFKIGDLGIYVYENERGLELYDPKELVYVKGDKELGVNRKNLRNILNSVKEENKVMVKMDEDAGQAERYLVNVYGIYDILYFIDTLEARKIRYSFTNILEEYRKFKGLSLGEFVKNCEAKEIDKVYKNVYSAGIESFTLLDDKEVFIKSAYSFVYTKDKDDNYVLVRNIDYFEHPEIIKDMDHHFKGEKLVFSLGITKLSEILSKIVSVDALNISDYIINNYPIEEINGNKYLDSRIFIKLVKNIGFGKCGDYLVLNDVYKDFKTDTIIDVILNKFVHITNEFQKNPLIESLTTFKNITVSHDNTVYKLFCGYKTFYYQRGCDDEVVYTKVQEKMHEYIKKGKVYTTEELENEI